MCVGEGRGGSLMYGMIIIVGLHLVAFGGRATHRFKRHPMKYGVTVIFAQSTSVFVGGSGVPHFYINSQVCVI